MASISEHIQIADWKKEKHVPVIECPGEVKGDTLFDVKVTLGKEISHPNTTEHHIRWVALYFAPENEKFVTQVARAEFNAHGESIEGANQGGLYTHHSATISMRTRKSGTFHALAYCNIHGLWESTKEIKVV